MSTKPGVTTLPAASISAAPRSGMVPTAVMGLSIEAYAQMVSDEKLILRLVALRRLCRE